MTAPFHFFLGGNDLEMQTIRDLLNQHSNAVIFDKQLAWGASSEDYKNDIENSIHSGATPVLIELTWNTPSIDVKKVILLDHHNEQAGKHTQTPLQQLFSLLKLSPTLWQRYHDLVVANDKGHIQGMLEIGATPEEIADIRAQDRAAQGITPENETQAKTAIQQAQQHCNNQLTLVTLPHDKASIVSDFLHPALGGNNAKNLLVIGPKELNFYGQGNIVLALSKQFEQGWYGGNLPDYGYWGMANTKDLNAVLQVIESLLK